MAMGDIAFNLLIFFVILARAEDDSQVIWTATTGVKLEQAKNVRVSVAIDKDRKIYVGGQEIAESALTARLKTELETAPPDQRTVLLKIHKETPAANFEPVIESISEAGGQIFHVLEREDES